MTSKELCEWMDDHDYSGTQLRRALSRYWRQVVSSGMMMNWRTRTKPPIGIERALEWVLEEDDEQ